MIRRRPARPNGCREQPAVQSAHAIAILGAPDVIVCAHRGIAHPCRDLARQTRPDLDVEDLTPGTSLPAVNANALTVKRMPGVRNHDKLRSVC